MKTLYIECSMGAAGDMLTAALIELLPDPDAFIERLNKMGIPGVRFIKESSEKCGIRGTHITVTVNGETEIPSQVVHDHDHAHAHVRVRARRQEHTHDHGHTHTHTHTHTHSHSALDDIKRIIEGLHVPDKVKSDAIAVYSIIAEAEGHAHGAHVSEIHFHEVGTMDAIADVSAVCLLMNELSPDETVVSPVHVGSGFVRCAHGILPVPAPATAHILRDVPIYGGRIKGELCTPTGAALLKHFASRFGDMPQMRTEHIGYGMGTMDFEAANCVRAFLGESEDRRDGVIELSCNLDDMTPEELGFAFERLFEGGALDVWAVPAVMKKSRPATVLAVLCRECDRDKMLGLIFAHTSTIGVRENVFARYVLDRRTETLDTPYGEVRVKTSEGYGVTRRKIEYEDIARIAKEKSLSISAARALIDELL
ncbi:MAG: nickel pincer cofactor biosynthesis protein LarC [Clostridia bacterium]|nr:nickel pincer cofactor biosynthesis protein LarC [Clostridia bacterium]